MFIISGAPIGFATVLYLSNMSVANYFVRYLWWRYTADITYSRGAVSSGDSRIHYAVYGRGPSILMLHGGLSNKLSWFSQIPELAMAGHRLILVDSRGHGLSGMGNDELGYRLLAADAEAVLDHLKIERTDVIGWSDGANTALLMSSLHPERVCRVVAISGNSSAEGLTPEARQENNRQSSGARYWLYRWWTGAGEKYHELERRLKNLWNNGLIVSAEDLKRITSPVLIIIGDHDLVSIAHAREMARLLPHSRLCIIRNGGHSTPITHAPEVNSLILSFLD